MIRSTVMARRSRLFAAVGATAVLTAAAFVLPARADTDPRAVIATYADIALAKYEDSLTTAKALDTAIDALIAKPSAETLAAAREAWKVSRVPYQQTEVYRFGNAIVDDWEGRVNAWPLDEGLIDYVDAKYGTESDENSLYTANVIANPSIEINGEKVDASAITPEFLSKTLQEAGDIEANVATGYHAIEFLLWGQDLNGTGPGSGSGRTPTTIEPTARAATATGALSILRPRANCLSPILRRWRPTGRREAPRARAFSKATRKRGSRQY